MTREHIHFVTGRLAAPALRRVVADIAAGNDFDFSIGVMPITVAALMTPEWIARRLNTPQETTRILLPGYCAGDLRPVSSIFDCPVDRGPSDLRQLPEYFGRAEEQDYGEYDVEILAEINHAPQLELDEILTQAKQLAADGADLIDVGCDPHTYWPGVSECVRALRDNGHRVSIDSFDPREVNAAVNAGAELVLSVNRSNREAAKDWDCAVVAIPDEPANLAGLEETLEYLAMHNVPSVVDPILEPIGCGFMQSLARYYEMRRRHQDIEMLMGIGNLTELTDADSAAVNLLLLGICQEMGIRKVLTTQVINWARSSVKECDLARRLAFHSIKHHIPPKHVEPNLVLLRDPKLHSVATLDFEAMADAIRDKNYRIYTDSTSIHVLCASLHLEDQDPFRLFERIYRSSPDNIDASHAFYLGFELSKAAIAIRLGKQYEQDESLNWGFLSVPEAWHRIKRQ